MRRVILNIAISLDGYIEGPKGEFDWCFTDSDYGMNEFMEGIDTIFMGRKSYELATMLTKDPYPALNKYVFSTTLSDDLPGRTIVISEDAEIQVSEIKKEAGKHIWLFGGAQLTSMLMNANLLDIIILSVHPVVLGGGYPLFLEIDQRKKLKLLDTKTYPSGLVQLFYQCPTV